MNSGIQKTLSGVVLDAQYSWESASEAEASCFLRGWYKYEEQIYRGQSAAQKIISLLRSLPEAARLKDILLKLSGNFAFILETPSYILAAADKIRSYPLFYSTVGNNIIISNSARLLQQKQGLHEKDEDSFLEFQMAGYVTGRRTLYKNLYQLQAGEYLFQKKGGQVECQTYFRYYPDQLSADSEKKLIEELQNVSLEVFQNLVRRLAGRPVWIPLSAGLDSRFVLAMLKEVRYDNINCFFYGAPGKEIWEAQYSRELAQKYGFSWKRINYEPSYLRSIFRSPLWQKFGIYADNLSSLSGYNMLYSLEWLKQKKYLAPGVVLINGQSGDFTSGNHLPDVIHQKIVGGDDLFRVIVDKHFSLWTDLKTEANIHRIRARYDEGTRDFDQDGSPQKAAGLVDCWEWRERQVKYIINGQRGYDYYGLAWKLPLWEDGFLNFWKKVPWRLKIRQNLYRKFLTQVDPGGAFRHYNPDRRPPLLKQWGARAFSLLTGILPPAKKEELKRQYMTAWMDPFNAHSVFPPDDYRKTARYHRNAVSYYTRYHLKDVLGEKI